MPRRIDMFELREVLRRLRDGEAVKLIHRQTGRHKTVIRTLKKIAEANGWLEAGRPLPDESLIAESYRARRTGREKEAHPLETLNAELERWLKEEKSFLVIHQLVSERGIDCSESTVRRYLRRRFAKPPRLVIPREHAAGEVMEVDFGYLCLARERRTGAVKKCWVFSARLCASRKALRVLVTDQRAATFFRCHMLAFEAWGGTPRTVRPDNLKAAVVKASFQEPLVNRSYRQLAEHYGFTISACLPYHPRHKGGVENDIKYVKRNFLPLAVEHARQRGHEPAYLDELEAELTSWSAATDERVVRGVGSTVNELFTEEQPSLQSLANERWEPVAWKQAKVGPDYRIQFDCGYYSAPCALAGERVLVAATSRTVRLFFEDKEVARHERLFEKWHRRINPAHEPPQAAEYLRHSAAGMRQWADQLGPAVRAVADAILSDRAVDGLRPLRALLGLAERYTPERLQAACDRAMRFDTMNYRSVKTILKLDLDQMPQQPLLPAMLATPAYRFQREAGYFNLGGRPWTN